MEGFSDLNLLIGDPYQQRTHRLLHLQQCSSVFVIPAFFFFWSLFCLAQSTNPVNSCGPQISCFPMLLSLKLERAFKRDKEVIGQSRGGAVVKEKGMNVCPRLLLKGHLCSRLKSNRKTCLLQDVVAESNRMEC